MRLANLFRKSPVPAASLALVGSLLGSVLAQACDNGTTQAPLPTYTPVTPEAGSFATGGNDAGHGSDATVARDAAADVAPPDAAVDAGASDAPGDTASAPDTGTDAGAVDAGTDAGAVDAGSDAPRVDAGTDSGTPDSGAPDAGQSSDGGAGAPVCMDVGTPNEGWYTSTGTLICVVSCAGLTATCQRAGTGAGGWYTTSGHGCPPHKEEVLNDPSCQ